MAGTLSKDVERGTFLIGRAKPEDERAIKALWKSTRLAPPREAPTMRLVARDAETQRLLGVADYFRTFPPEDVLFVVAVVPAERGRGVGTALLRMLARNALRNGRRNLCAFIGHDDLASWRLLRSAGIPLRIYDVEGGCYVELDLVPLLQEQLPDDAWCVAPSLPGQN